MEVSGSASARDRLAYPLASIGDAIIACGFSKAIKVSQFEYNTIDAIIEDAEFNYQIFISFS